MKKYLAILFFISLNWALFGQTKIQWDFSYNSVLKAVEIEATLADGWHLYSQHVDNEIGPVPTSFSFDENELVKLIGRVNEPAPIQKYDENFEAMLDFFEGKVVFSQRLSAKENSTLNGSVSFMICNDVMCFPPSEEKFSIQITK